MRRRHWRTVVAATAALSMALASVAIADEFYGDELEVRAQTGSLDLGTVCAGDLAEGTISLAIVRTTSGNPNIFRDGSTVAVAPQAPSNPALSAGPASGSIVLPLNWSSSPQNTTWSDAVTAAVSLDTSEVLGAFSGQVTYRASGKNMQGTAGNDIVRYAHVNVTAVVEDCAPADTTPPEVEIDLEPTDPNGDNDWYTSTVTIAVNATDEESDVDSVEYRVSVDGGDFTEWAPYTEPIPFDEDGKYEFEARATSAGGPSEVKSVSFKIDATPPVVTVTGVEDGAVYTLGSVPEAGCNTTDATSGVATQAVASTVGGPVNSVTTTCSGATDKAGNQTDPVSVTYSVRYDFAGFFRPVDMGTADDPVFNRVKAGQAIPMKFTLDGDQGLNILKDGWPKSYPVACDETAEQQPVEETVTAGKSSLSYDDGQYNYVWKTEKGWAGSCRAFSLGLTDGSTQIAYFNFTR
jgi:hypothetical protein